MYADNPDSTQSINAGLTGSDLGEGPTMRNTSVNMAHKNVADRRQGSRKYIAAYITNAEIIAPQALTA